MGTSGLVCIRSSSELLELLLEDQVALALLTAGASLPFHHSAGLPNAVMFGTVSGTVTFSGGLSGDICMLELVTPRPGFIFMAKPYAFAGSVDTIERPPLLTETAPGEFGGLPSC